VDKSFLLNCRKWPGTEAALRGRQVSVEEEWAAEVEEVVDHSEEEAETHMVAEEEHSVDQDPGVHMAAEEEVETHMEEGEVETSTVEEEVVHMVGEQVVQEFHDRHLVVEIEARQKSDHDQCSTAEVRSVT
jgi:hypothetical protein